LNPTSHRTAGGGSTASTSTADPRHRDAPIDPNSDTTPPQLVSIDFVPPQVQDGQEASVVIVANDDLSGVRGISGTIISPTGKAVQGFSEQRDADTSRYVGRVLIPKDAEAGLWHVNFVSLSDNASNSVTLSFAQGTVPASAVLRVTSSNSDNTPPTLNLLGRHGQLPLRYSTSEPAVVYVIARGQGRAALYRGRGGRVHFRHTRLSGSEAQITLVAVDRAGNRSTAVSAGSFHLPA